MSSPRLSHQTASHWATEWCVAWLLVLLTAGLNFAQTPQSSKSPQPAASEAGSAQQDVPKGSTTPTSDLFRYPERRYQGGELRYRAGLPVLTVQGTPQQIGQQVAELAAVPAKRLIRYPEDCVKALGLKLMWQVLVASGEKLLHNFPQQHSAELEAMIQHAQQRAQLRRDLFISGNTLFDITKAFGCSTLLVDAQRSATGGVLLGRNLDFPTLGYLNRYTLVTVYRPTNKRAWASIGFPGVIGCLSGINDAGLTVAVLEVYSTADGAPKFDLSGTPFAICYRRVLEECSTVDEAVKLLRSMKRTTCTNLAICDPQGGGVVEITPKSVVFRRPEPNLRGFQPCTNHFRSKGLAQETRCWRYTRLSQAAQQFGMRPVQLTDVQSKLHEVRQSSTLQTMIFEPATLKLHLAIGPCPTTELPLKTLNLKPLLATAQNPPKPTPSKPN